MVREHHHDHSYKLLFSHPEMIADLLRGYVRQPWVEQLDFSSLERADGHYVTADLREREDDLIWRIKWADGERWLYIYLLLEFQSTPDAFMAQRVMTYLGLLYQDLLKAGQLSPAGKLPPVLPLVLYNGERPWRASVELSELIDTIPGGLEAFRPALRYLLLDESRHADDVLPSTRNLVAGLFGLENSRTPDDVRRVLRQLLVWLAEPEQLQLRRHFAVWLKRVLLPSRMRGINFEQLNDLQEIDSMLAERVKDWTRDWREQGLEEGRRQGREEGRAEGRAEGERAALVRQLTRRFGSLDADTVSRLENAGSAELTRWLDNILDAATLDEVFRGE
ncbi:transposase [Ectopseudomonas mendocina]|uniref:Transposase n=1 Tax=Ectopseudomonas mendocina TaxID=300 RepID=A0ABD7RYY5_ECTME|nr:Rpn family recombination-promoting nuclease/putative transposase [Pseudomonas mendocina]TRO15279.1 transposase [Pseudomonas mendocina]TRO18062.1 transposase [Pseudomonas mendocina]